MAKKPNLLYVFADQLRRTSCGYAGYANAITPNIDAFHDQSMDFCQAVSGHPVCSPSQGGKPHDRPTDRTPYRAVRHAAVRF